MFATSPVHKKYIPTMLIDYVVQRINIINYPVHKRRSDMCFKKSLYNAMFIPGIIGLER